ncbi:hypothetical protein HK097_006790 [Rhizophlyctis rosea]|uniref:Calcineurin-like phosphoesterase domain-containing protein n=1 Tax=Rhizophlyctis rosea TaxID=64517 RepID=A0AAD5SKP1_9FUNG|nr:hypothetical protein HK097_006790 [Rhizophlyctis rosea]
MLLDSVSKFAEEAAAKRKQQEEFEFLAVLEALSSVSKNVLYVPGNHDPESAFPDKYLRRIRSEPPTSLYKPTLVGSTQRERVPEKEEDLPVWQRGLNKFGAFNVHQRMVRLAPNLIVAGHGGAIGQTLKSDPDTEIHHGYPYTEDELIQGVNKLFSGKRHMLAMPAGDVIRVRNPIAGNAGQDPDKCILVTHCGPGASGKPQLLSEASR